MAESLAHPEKKGPVVLVTGGAGFLGRFLVGELQRREGEGRLAPSEIRVFDLNPCDFEDPDRVVFTRGDVRAYDGLRAAFEGVDVVFHCAALVDWGQHPGSLVEAVNVDGTRNVIRAAAEAGVRVLVCTSSEDVVYDGSTVVDGDETIPYPKRYGSTYCRTKAEAEQAALSANGMKRNSVGVGADDGEPLRTAAIRPCSIFGEGDEFHIGSLIKMARTGTLVRVGDPKARYQPVYVGNVAYAHVLAAEALLRGDEKVAGEAYFITDVPAANFFDFLEPFVEAAGYRVYPRWVRVPGPVMYGVACVVEAVTWLLRPVVRLAPVVSRFAVDYMCHDYTFVSHKARRDLGYVPLYSEEEAVARTMAHYRKQGA